jgi:hypothetical protein
MVKPTSSLMNRTLPSANKLTTPLETFGRAGGRGQETRAQHTREVRRGSPTPSVRQAEGLRAHSPGGAATHSAHYSRL